MAGPGRRRWDDRWQSYPESKPIATDDGIATSKQRGVMATTWWSKRFIDVLDSYGLGSRMQRGRRYARTGQVLSLDVRAGQLLSQVQGSRSTPYVVTIEVEAPTEVQWAKVVDALRSRIGFAARLLAGEVPPDLEEVFATASVQLFPARWEDLGARCSCPDWENPCKHLAAVLYVFADQLDADPWLLLAWRGRTRDELLGALHLGAGAAGDPAEAEEVAPWWPTLPTSLVVAVHDESGRVRRRDLDHLELASSSPDQLVTGPLDRLEALDVVVAGAPVIDLLTPAYELLAGSDDVEPDSL